MHLKQSKFGLAASNDERKRADCEPCFATIKQDQMAILLVIGTLLV